MATISRHPVGKRFVALVAACGIATFVICYLLLRSDGRGEDRDREAANAEYSVVAPIAESPPVVEGPAATSQGGQVAVPETIVPASPTAPMNHTSKSAPRTGPPQSITLRARRSPVRQTAPASSMQTSDAAQPEVQLKAVSRSIELTSNLKTVCSGCSHSRSNGISIPRPCTYDSHTLTQLDREPFVPIEVSDKSTAYMDYVDSDASGRIGLVTLSVSTDGASMKTPSITMRLTVVAKCPSDANLDGWTDVLQPARSAETPTRRSE